MAQDYLKTIWTARVVAREVSTKMLAERIGVSASTASESIRKLADQGLVHHEKYGAVTLTDTAERPPWPWCAVIACSRRSSSANWATAGTRCTTGRDPRARGVRPDVGPDGREAGLPTQDPHGDPIPAADGRVPTPARQLSDCTDGETGTVARISDADPEMLRYFDTVGINLDSRVRVLARRDFAGLVSVQIENSGRSTASNWEVRPPRRFGSCRPELRAWAPGRRPRRTRRAGRRADTMPTRTSSSSTRMCRMCRSVIFIATASTVSPASHHTRSVLATSAAGTLAGSRPAATTGDVTFAQQRGRARVVADDHGADAGLMMIACAATVTVASTGIRTSGAPIRSEISIDPAAGTSIPLMPTCSHHRRR